MKRLRKMTAEEREQLLWQPLPPMRNVVYTGALWAGTIVNDNFFADISGEHNANSGVSRYLLNDAALNGRIAGRITKSQEYDGIYRDAVNITQADAVALFSEGGE